MILAVQSILRLLGEGAIMLNKHKGSKLSKELLYIFLLDFSITIFTFFFLRSIASSLLYNYCDSNNIVLDELQEINYLMLLTALSILCATLEFVVLFLVLVGQKLAYLKDITAGISALTTHRLNYEIPVKGNNEFTQLAVAINNMSKAELELKKKEEDLAKERENFVRSMSHDIRTPLTAIIAHSEYLKSKESIESAKIEEYFDMTLRKTTQIKDLTNKLLNSGLEQKEHIENGRLFFIQLLEDFEDNLDDEFKCKVSIHKDVIFSGDYDIQKFIRIFDNLSSNIKKYADGSKDIFLNVYLEDGRIVISQTNYKLTSTENVESHKLGLSIIEDIAKGFGGHVDICQSDETFTIKIVLFTI